MESNTDPVQDAESDKTVEFGLSANIAAALSYIPIIAVIYLIVEDNNEFVRFHAGQSIVYFVAWLVVSIVVGIVVGILNFVPVLGTIGSLLSLVVRLGGFALWFFLIYQAFSEVKFELPVLADPAESLTQAI